MISTAASAHPFHGTAAGAVEGFLHPFTGLDHLLAMVAVGLWAAQLGGRTRWIVPGAFVGAMLAGGALGFAELVPPFAEQMVAASGLVLGLLIVTRTRLAPPLGAALVGAFALYHGAAHAAELPAAASALAYAAGFCAATVLLLAAGVGAGSLIAQRFSRFICPAG
ncbi:MAG TPA: HupE/UreJ family protein [Burkholderiales bacterium]|nr:HupE/UreJ family protein [Burkholderiales bacterium]